MTSPQITAGTKIYISASLPALNAAADFVLLPWTQIRGVRLAGELGNVWETRDDKLIDKKFGTRVKGVLMFNALPLEIILLAGDEGQAILLNASALVANYAFKIERADKGIRYFVAQVVTYVESQGNDGKSLFDAVASIEQQDVVVFA
ncbi:MAG TPA: hypothetical protein VK958_06525 [Methylophilus sp.]|uniref:hypothetical protein n=1 Tax=Methylophilus sp. TaxID=29541 RepID=UPI002C10F604|nr:hypothetical protein [Methylophilus sp.]HSH86890.1 hypothetical protein [Methylophilus sp.]